MTKPLIFITNDDGVNAKGFRQLVEVAARYGRVIAIAPAEMQSGKSNAITMYKPLFLKKVVDEPDKTIYSLTGTPVDCAKMAFDNLLVGEKVSLALSGINHGSNAATNVLYSGTMGAAIEAAFYNIPSIGLSNLDHSDDADFEACIEYGIRIARNVLEGNMPRPLCLNVNIPILPVEQIKGVKVCRQTRGFWKDEFFKRTDPHGRDYYWVTGGFDNHEPEATDTDEWALQQGYVSIVPIQVDLTAYNQLEQLNDVL